MKKKPLVEDVIKDFDDFILSKVEDKESAFNRFQQKLNNASENMNLIDSIKYHWKSCSAIFISLLSIGFLLARFTMPMNIATKSIDFETYQSDKSTTITEIYDRDTFNLIINNVVENDLEINFQKKGNFKKLFIFDIKQKGNHELKKILKLDIDFEGPVTILFKD